MRKAALVLGRLEESLRSALEGVGRLLPGKLQPLEMAAELERALEQSQTQGPEGVFVANRYHVLLAPADLELFGGLRQEIELQLAQGLLEHAEEQGLLTSPLIVVTLEPEEKTPPGRIVVRSEFHDEPLSAALTVAGGLPAQTWEIFREAVLGRSDLCQVRLEEAAISRRHARIWWTYAGYMIEDLGSSNGVFVGGEPVQQTLLREGDLIELGLVQLRFSYRAAA
ncbi:MAG TPA: FhaA domain-containing protein [Armatimonadota bacterium]|jgi:hypothetical protein